MVDQPGLGEIRLFAYAAVPDGWMPCDGRELSMSQYSNLFGAIGTAYGGNGTTTFCLPDLRDNVLVCAGGEYVPGQTGGAFNHTLTIAELPSHRHGMQAVDDNSDDPTKTSGQPDRSSKLSRAQAALPNNAGAAPVMMYGVGDLVGGQSLNTLTLGPTGQDRPHPNLQPYVTLAYCIAVQGL